MVEVHPTHAQPQRLFSCPGAVGNNVMPGDEVAEAPPEGNPHCSCHCRQDGDIEVSQKEAVPIGCEPDVPNLTDAPAFTTGYRAPEKVSPQSHGNAGTAVGVRCGSRPELKGTLIQQGGPLPRDQRCRSSGAPDHEKPDSEICFCLDHHQIPKPAKRFARIVPKDGHPSEIREAVGTRPRLVRGTHQIHAFRRSHVFTPWVRST